MKDPYEVLREEELSVAKEFLDFDFVPEDGKPYRVYMYEIVYFADGSRILRHAGSRIVIALIHGHDQNTVLTVINDAIELPSGSNVVYLSTSEFDEKVKELQLIDRFRKST